MKFTFSKNFLSTWTELPAKIAEHLFGKCFPINSEIIVSACSNEVLDSLIASTNPDFFILVLLSF